MRQSILNRNTFRAIVVVGAGLLLPGVVWGQFGATGTGTGTGVGMGTSSGGGGRSSNAGGTSASGMFGGQTPGGSRPGADLAPTAMGGASTGGNRFLDANRQGAFVGADSRDAGVNALSTGQTTTGRNSMQGLQGLQGLGSMFSSMGRDNPFGGDQNSRGNARAQLRIPIRIGFQSKPIATTRVMTEFQTRLTKLPALKGVGKIQVALEGGTAVLRGTVATEGDKQLAADLAMLEPAIADVRNELVVDPAVTTAEVLSPTVPTPVRP